MELAACHPCGIQDFAVAPRFLEIVWFPVFGNVGRTNRNEVVKLQRCVMFGAKNDKRYKQVLVLVRLILTFMELGAVFGTWH